LKSKVLQFYASYALVDVRFLNALELASNSPFADVKGNIQVLPGNVIPAIPRIASRQASIIRSPMHSRSEATRFWSAAIISLETSPIRPGYAVFNQHGSYQLTRRSRFTRAWTTS
jgi:hypothetical protein